MSSQQQKQYVTLNAADQLERGIFEALILQAAESPDPAYICDLETDPTLHEVLKAEGRARAADNSKRLGARWNGKSQNIPRQSLTKDEIGRVCEYPIETMLGLDVAAVLEGATDNRPDKTVDGVRFDVKGAENRPFNTFSLPQYKVDGDAYDALLLVRLLAPGQYRIWCCRCAPQGGCWKACEGKAGNHDFYLIRCPDGFEPSTH